MTDERWDPETLASIPPAELPYAHLSVGERLILACMALVLVALVVTTMGLSRQAERIQREQLRLAERIAVLEADTKRQEQLIGQAVDLTELGRLILEREHEKDVVPK